MTTSSVVPAGVAQRRPMPGVAFRETMAGWFAMGATDPEDGARRGRAQGTQLRIRVAISVPDLDRFLEDHEHPGAIAGRVDFGPLGSSMPAERGDFRLVAPADAAHLGTPVPGAKLMVYGLSFVHEGRDLHLAGHKLVRGGNPLRMWAETTTLYTTLHRYGIGVGPTLGAGILRLGPVDFVGILPTLRAPGAAGVGESLATLTRFGRFFAGQLWDSYARGGRAARHA